jgi:hypothetical protein
MRAGGRLRADRAIATSRRLIRSPRKTWRLPLENVPSAHISARALQLIASIPFGAAEAAMFLHGFTRRVLARLDERTCSPERSRCAWRWLAAWGLMGMPHAALALNSISSPTAGAVAHRKRG